MKKKYFIIIIMVAALGFVNSCSSDFLEVDPNGSLDQATLANEDGVNNLLIGAYSMLDGWSNQFTFDAWDGNTTNWLWASIRGMEANKGSDAGDQAEMNSIQSFTEEASNAKINNKWRLLYEGISRCNSTIIAANLTLTAGDLTAEETDLIIKQARALRGHYHFEAWKLWGGKIPYVDENTDPITVTNTADVRSQIIADLDAGTALPNDMDQIGRFNGTVCKILKAKAMMQMNNDYDGALAILLDARTNGTKPDGSAIGFAPTYGEIFDIEKRNGIESIYTVQYSVNDGSGGANGGNTEVLNFPYKGNNGSPAGCCGFYIPNQEFVNTFRTVDGLPMPNYTYNDDPVLNDQGVAGGGLWDATVKYTKGQGCTVYDPAEPFRDLGYVCIDTTGIKGANPLTNPDNWELRWTEDVSKPVDPRLDWAVGRRGIQYWDWGVHTGSDWIRDQSYSGPYSSKKQVYKKSQAGQFTEIGSWTSGYTANGYRMIRYADLVLMIAECHILKASPDYAAAMAAINEVRARAMNPAGFVKESDGTTNAATYEIELYTTPWTTVADALYALEIERKLELGLEGHRYFDLNRWGKTVEVLNKVLTYQKSLSWGTSLYGNATTVGTEDVSYPIPQRQIDLSNGALVQNR